MGELCLVITRKDDFRRFSALLGSALFFVFFDISLPNSFTAKRTFEATSTILHVALGLTGTKLTQFKCRGFRHFSSFLDCFGVFLA